MGSTLKTLFVRKTEAGIVYTFYTLVDIKHYLLKH